MSNEKHISKKNYYYLIDMSREEGINRILRLIDAMVDGGDADKVIKLPGNAELQEEMYKKYHMTRWLRDLTYRVNPFCPECGEEHNYYYVQITEDEQRKIEDFYEKNKGRSDLVMLISREYPLSITRTFECPCCHAEFEATVFISKESYQGKKIGPMENDGSINDW
ncbi:MAG: hypothetical protein LUD81_11110 [Clostridiales bacterium]|nr:hypothetical protein [Clostridiales bacterium]